MQGITTPSSDEQSNEKPSRTIINQIADLEGTSPTELTPPLYSVVDPDALDSLFHSSTSDKSETSGQVRFRYNGYVVCVQSNDEISIVEA